MKCPKCGKEITHAYTQGVSYADTYLDDDEETLLYDEVNVDYFGSEYFCPECHELITDVYDELVKLLRGEV